MQNVFEAPRSETHNNRTISSPPRFHTLPSYFVKRVADIDEYLTGVAFVSRRNSEGTPTMQKENSVFHVHADYKVGNSFKHGQIFNVSPLGKDDQGVDGYLISATMPETPIRRRR